MDLGLNGRAAVVTGASGDIGRAVARALSHEGARVVLVGRRADALGALARELSSGASGETGTVRELALDVTAPDAGERMRDVCVELWGRYDVLVNNAGTTSVRSLEQLTDEEWDAQWQLHVMAPMRAMRAAAPVMAESGWGRIVNISSSSGKRPSGTNLAYSTTKAAILSLSRGFADRFAERGVLVNAVTPGPIAGEMWLGEGGLADQQAAIRGVTRAAVLEQAAAKLPLGRLGTPEEIASVVSFLCSEAASNVTGVAWSVDGGAVPVII